MPNASSVVNVIPPYAARSPPNTKYPMRMSPIMQKSSARRKYTDAYFYYFCSEFFEFFESFESFESSESFGLSDFSGFFDFFELFSARLGEPLFSHTVILSPR